MKEKEFKNEFNSNETHLQEVTNAKEPRVLTIKRYEISQALYKW